MFCHRQAAIKTYYILLANTECAEDTIQNIVGGGGASDAVDRRESAIEIEYQQFVRNGRCGGGARFREHLNGLGKEILLTQAGDETAFDFELAARGKLIQN